MRIITLVAAIILLPALASADVACGGSFNGFVSKMRAAAVAKGHSQATVNRFFKRVRQDPKVLKADRSQGVFKKDFIAFSRAVISKSRINKGRANFAKYKSVFRRVEREYGVAPGVLLAFWALETDYGAFQGSFNTLNSLMTLSHDCRRPDLFRPQVFSALELYERGDFDPVKTKGAWAGEVGMVQMLPADILENGVDGDGDGKISLKTSPADALLSGARMLQDFGWRANEPWLQEISVPKDLDWSMTGVDKSFDVNLWKNLGVRARSGSFEGQGEASVLLPMGRKGPAFLAYPNYQIYFDWNQSFVYVTTAAYFATRLSGAPIYKAGNPDPGLSDRDMKALQERLTRKGYDVGKIDGILGSKTRAAIQKEQARLGLPADAWPTRGLLKRL